jgi:malate dehydrogenase (oxaloacetate-decarboxylating)(NADP+)
MPTNKGRTDNGAGLSGSARLRDPFSNKGTAFTEEERASSCVRGLLPPRVLGMDAQEAKVLENFNEKTTDLEKYLYLISVQDENTPLFYRFVIDNIAQAMPIIYTPTVGTACQRYSHVSQRQRGMFISAKDKGHIAGVLRNWPTSDVSMIVATDGERILGLGDLGANGMGIPVGKLSLYTACAGIDPARCLPLLLDVGTENAPNLADPLYIGLPQHRVRGGAYDELVDELIMAVQEVFPQAVFQFEDFATSNAFGLLAKYRDRVCTFNDDIQGTGAVGLAGVYSALKITGQKLKDQEVLFLGAGEANIGVGGLIVSAMMADGLSEKEALGRCWFFDSSGLVVKGRKDLPSQKARFAQEHGLLADFPAAVEELKPTVLIGASAQAKAFTRRVLEAMAKINERPIVFAMSNPTSKAECTAEEAYTWTEGRAVFASGSPFQPVTVSGGRYAGRIEPGQCNNAYIFPGLGLGIVASQARTVTDEMIFTAAKALADEVTAADLKVGRIFPALSRIRDVSAAIGAAVATVAFDKGLARCRRPDDILASVRSQMWEPMYRS